MWGGPPAAPPSLRATESDHGHPPRCSLAPRFAGGCMHRARRGDELRAEQLQFPVRNFAAKWLLQFLVRSPAPPHSRPGAS